MRSSYHKKFVGYLKDLAEAKFFVGGGSAVALGFCLGCSLILKAINFTIKQKNFSATNLMNLKKAKEVLEDKCKSILNFVDLDGEIFDKILRSKGKERLKFLAESERLICKIGLSCKEIFSIAKKIKSDIKKSILSDYYIGLEFINLALVGCLYNLEANKEIFGRESRYTKILKAIRLKYGKNF